MGGGWLYLQFFYFCASFGDKTQEKRGWRRLDWNRTNTSEHDYEEQLYTDILPAPAVYSTPRHPHDSHLPGVAAAGAVGGGLDLRANNGA